MSNAQDAADAAARRLQQLERETAEVRSQYARLMQQLAHDTELAEGQRAFAAERERMQRESSEAKDRRAREMAAAVILEKGSGHGS